MRLFQTRELIEVLNKYYRKKAMVNMTKKATKAANNVFYLARCNAATFNGKLSSRDGAGEVTGLDKTRIARIELETLVPYPEEVVLLADSYNAPELENYFCSHLCPIGRSRVPSVEVLQLDRITLRILSALKNVDFVRQTIVDVVGDGVITEDERPKLNEILGVLESISKAAMEMELFVRKNLKEE